MPLLLQTIPSFLVEWPPYEAVLRTDSEEVYREGLQVPESSSIRRLHRRRLPMMQTLSRENRGHNFLLD